MRKVEIFDARGVMMFMVVGTFETGCLTKVAKEQWLNASETVLYDFWQ